MNDHQQLYNTTIRKVIIGPPARNYGAKLSTLHTYQFINTDTLLPHMYDSFDCPFDSFYQRYNINKTF